MSISHSAQYFALISFAQIMRILPRRIALFFGACIGQLGWWTRLKRRLVLSNLRQALPNGSNDELLKIASRSARNFTRTITEFVRFDGRDRQNLGYLVSVEGIEKLEAAIQAGKGCLLITGHLGAWALYFSAISGKGIPISLLVGKQHNQRVDQFIHGISGTEVTLISKGRSAIKRILQSLDQGRCIVMVADQHAGPNGILSEFMGRKASTLTLPAAFVARNDIPIFTMAGHRVENGRHQVNISPLAIADNPDKEALKQDVTDAFNQAIGAAVLEHPDQYFWFHRRWRDSDADLDQSSEPPAL